MLGQSPIFIISRADAIGDVVLTLPMAGVLKKHYPNSTVLFLGRTYTQPIVACCTAVDGFINYDNYSSVDALAQALKQTNADAIIHVFPKKEIAQAAKKAGIAMRIGTSHRWFNWLTCNYRVNFSRKNSNLHEAELNLKLLQPFKIKVLAKEDLANLMAFNPVEPLPSNIEALLQPNKFNLVLHPLSNGSGKNWGLANFGKLIELLPPEKFNLFITGTKAEGEQLTDFLQQYNTRITPLTGQLTLGQLITFISKANGLVAASTGPLHIAAITGINAVGLYPTQRPMHPGRWQPLGPKVKVFESDDTTAPHLAISPQTVADYLGSL